MSEQSSAVEVGRWVDPESVFLSLYADRDHAFWLDAGPDAVEGWSWVGAGEPEPDPDVVRAISLPSRTMPRPPGGRFRGGWVGYSGYDDAARRAGAPSSDDAIAPDAAWLRVTTFVAFDHGAKRVWALGPNPGVTSLAEAVASVADRPPQLEASASATLTARARHSPDEYAGLIEDCRDRIRAGDAYQLCLTTRFDVDGPVHPIESFRRLRALTPAHHGGLIRVGGMSLASASPERFLEVDGSIVRTRPIKGTRPRSEDATIDAQLATELRTSEKERAENVMIVDLMRNDLSQVCEPGSVGVDRLLEIESYPAVHQLVSTVSGTLVPGTTVDDLLAAAFPAGSMTGAPKLSAMSILHGLEHAPRGVFAGAFGWIGFDGELDLAMVIRSIVVHPEGAYVGAGGGITWRSEAAAEVSEVGVKARGPLSALGADLPAGW